MSNKRITRFASPTGYPPTVSRSATAGPALAVGRWLVELGQGEAMRLLATPLSAAVVLAFPPLPERPPAAEVAFES